MEGLEAFLGAALEAPLKKEVICRAGILSGYWDSLMVTKGNLQHERVPVSDEVFDFWMLAATQDEDVICEDRGLGCRKFESAAATYAKTAMKKTEDKFSLHT